MSHGNFAFRALVPALALAAAVVFASTAAADPLPDGRAYEQVTPVDKNGANATGERNAIRAASDGAGITFMSTAGFPGAEGFQNWPSFLARRTPDKWMVQGLLPPAQAGSTGSTNTGVSDDLAFSFPAGKPFVGEPFTAYLRETATGTMTAIGVFPNAFTVADSSADASKVAIESRNRLPNTNATDKKENVYVWDRTSRTLHLGSVLNNGWPATTSGSFAGSYQNWNSSNTSKGGAGEAFFSRDAHVLSRDGESLYFTAAGSGQVYLRTNPTAGQSPLADGITEVNGAASGTGNLVTGSPTVGGLVVAKATTARTTINSPVVTSVKPTVGRFVPGQPIEPVAGKIPAGATVLTVEELNAGEYKLTLSANAEATATNVTVASPGPQPFAVGQAVTGPGIPFGTKVSAVSAGSLTLSAAATANGSGVALVGSTECVDPEMACTVQVSASERTTPDTNGIRPAAFVGATPDGSTAFFTSPSQLTDNATTGATDVGNDLYRYRPDAPLGERLTDLSVDTDDPNGAEVKGVLGYSDDGTYVYFVAAGRIPGTGAPVSTCVGSGSTVSGLCNLYLSREDPSTHALTISYVAQLNGVTDNASWARFGRAGGNLPIVPQARVAGQSGTLLFGSARSLTGYNNVGPCGSGNPPAIAPCTEYYIYRPGPGFACISCNPTGQPPLGSASYQSIRTFGKASFLPVLSRNLSADGTRAFFETPDPLLAADVNGRNGCPPTGRGAAGFGKSCQDVYEWELQGHGSCQQAGVAGGCLYLISGGSSPKPSFFGDASTSGNDAFIFTQSQLVGQDKDELVDIYDARVGGGIPSQNPSEKAQCQGADQCKGTPSAPPPASPSPATGTFTGPGNVKTEKPRKAKKHRRHHRHRAHKGKRANGAQKQQHKKGQGQGRGRR